MNFEDKIRKIISNNLKNSESVDDFDIEGNLQNIGMDSIVFISIVVAIEDEFKIRFPDDMLIATESCSIASLCRIVELIVAGV